MYGLKKIMYGVTDFPRMRRENADYTIQESRANGLRLIAIGKKGARYPAVVAVALVEGK